MSDEGKTIARRLHEDAISKGNLTLLDDILAPGLIYHGPAFSGEVNGAEGFKHLIATLIKAFPDLREIVEDQVAEGDRVATRYKIFGTHMGELVGTDPSGVRIAVSGIDISRIVDGKIEEIWANFDALAILQQVGAAPLIELPKPKTARPSPADIPDLTLERFKYQEATDKIGRRLRIIVPFAGLGKGIEGRVIGTALDPGGYTVEVAWRIPGKADPLVKRTTKAEYESYLIEI